MALLFFILGLLFALIISPLLDSLLSFFVTWLEVKRTKYREEIHAIEVRMAAPPADPPQRLIGFALSEEDLIRDDTDDI